MVSSTPRSGRSRPTRTCTARTSSRPGRVCRRCCGTWSTSSRSTTRIDSKKWLKQRGDSIGAFVIEPILGNAGSITADAQYLKDARELCDRFDVVMLIDEVKTGFRVARGGVQELMNVRADLCTFAKALGNGYPISALAGREDIMRDDRR